MGSVSGKRKRTVVYSLVIALFIIAGFRFSASRRHAITTQDELENENILGLSSLLTDVGAKLENSIILKKLLKVSLQQDDRLKLLERQNSQLLKSVRELKKPASHMAIRGKLLFLYPYDPSVKFPAYVWQLWKHGLNDERFDKDFLEGERQWAVKNPGFVHELFNDDTAHAFICFLYEDFPEIIDTYEKLPELVLKMDFFRYLILFAKGGVYADIDTFPFQPIPNWIPENIQPDEVGLIIGVGRDHTDSADLSIEQRKLQLGQFVIQAKPGHPILRETIALIVEYTQSLSKDTTDSKPSIKGLPKLKGSTPAQLAQAISTWTGSSVFTDCAFRYFNDWVQSAVFQKVTWREFDKIKKPKLVSDVLVMPVRAFATKLEYRADGKVDDPLAFVKHLGLAIWREDVKGATDEAPPMLGKTPQDKKDTNGKPVANDAGGNPAAKPAGEEKK